jgi:periplasmic divalent cation tolerance protein
MTTDTDVAKSELIAFVTAPNGEEAAQLAEALVSEQLAACVNLVAGIESIYRWEGRVARDREVLLIIKTTGERYEALEQRVKELHSYTTPEVIAFRVERGSREYIDWLRRSTEIS